MAYVKQEWVDHIAEHPGRIGLQELENDLYQIVKAEGELIQQGSPVTANRMNHIESGIYSAQDKADIAKNLAMSLSIQVAIITGAYFGDVGGDIILEDMVNIQDIQVNRGIYDQVNQRIYAVASTGQEVVMSGYGAAYE